MCDFIFIGGSGRSGTSFLTEAIGLNERVVSFPTVELKFLISRGGLLDLRYSLVQEYNIDGAQQALAQFDLFLSRVLYQAFYNKVSVESYCDPVRLRQAVDKFMASMRSDGRAAPNEAPAFDDQARALLEGIYSARMRDAETVKAKYFLEKTPHALLHMNSLHQMFPGSRFIHVMRDPRAVVMSLLRMDWAPNTIDECITWLKCYCRAWARSRNLALSSGIALLDFRLEDIAAAPADAVTQLRSYLDLDIADDVFAGVRPNIASTWREACTVEELNHLTASLSEEVAFLGYGDDERPELER